MPRNQRHLLTDPAAIADFLARFQPDDLGDVEHLSGVTYTTGHVDGDTPAAVLHVADRGRVLLDVAILEDEA